MIKIAKYISIFFLSLSLSFLTYKLCYSISEKYFFDKFFFRKSISYGYGVDYLPLSEFGYRAQNLQDIYLNNQNILGISDDNTYKIAVIGDSFVWGQGIKNEDRFPYILEKKLNKIKKTSIVSLAKPGWNILDYLDAYQKLIKNQNPDLIIFSLVNNDNLVNPNSFELPLVKSCINNNNILPIVVNNYFIASPPIPIPEINNKIIHDIDDAWNNSTNSCILNKALQELPTQNTIFFLTEDYNGQNSQFISFKNQLISTNKYYISSSIGKNIAKYKKYWNNYNLNTFQISKMEQHPNPLANQMYADILYTEITTNSKWNFKK